MKAVKIPARFTTAGLAGVVEQLQAWLESAEETLENEELIAEEIASRRVEAFAAEREYQRAQYAAL